MSIATGLSLSTSLDLEESTKDLVPLDCLKERNLEKLVIATQRAPGLVS